jgi:hypothetical protein
MPRTPPTPEQLRDQSPAVLHHCIMLKQTHALYAEHVAKSRDDPPGMRQALATSFAIHARCLHQFFYWRDAKGRDVSAGDYVATWDSIRPTEKLSDDDVTRIDTEIAHLSRSRMRMPVDGYGFDVEGMFETLRPTIERFWISVDATLLAPDVQGYVAKLPAREPQHVFISVLDVSRVASANVATPPMIGMIGGATVTTGKLKERGARGH